MEIVRNRGITDITSEITQQVLYAPFGEVISEYNAYWMLDTIPRFLFNAKELYDESGMYYYSARYSAPPTFISRDPLFEEKHWLNPYHYCSNNPVSRIDPTGMLDTDFGIDCDGVITQIGETNNEPDSRWNCYREGSRILSLKGDYQPTTIQSGCLIIYIIVMLRNE